MEEASFANWRNENGFDEFISLFANFLVLKILWKSGHSFSKLDSHSFTSRKSLHYKILHFSEENGSIILFQVTVLGRIVMAPRLDGTPGETDPVILARRQRQIDFGKNSPSYHNYITHIPK